MKQNKIKHYLKKIRNKLFSFKKNEKNRETKFLNTLYEELISKPSTYARIKSILSVNEFHPSLQEVLAEDERALPGNTNFQESGYFKTMLTRYALAMYFSKNKKVLDTCSGLGWGAYLLEIVTKELFCIELDPKAITAAKKLWDYSNCKWVQGSVLELPFPDNSFDIVTAMESIEHFTLEDAETYTSEIYRVLKPKGKLVGSTPLPKTQEGIDKELATNPYHLHVFTPAKLEEFLKTYFRKAYLYQNNRFFWAMK